MSAADREEDEHQADEHQADGHQADEKEAVEHTWLDEREHALRRPENLIGSIHVEQVDWYACAWATPSAATEATPAPAVRVQAQRLAYAPAALHVIDEILSNACDAQFVLGSVSKTLAINRQMKRIELGYDAKTGEVSVLNNGSFIAVEKWPGSELYRPTVYFSEFRSSTKLNDDMGPRFKAGRNGFGVKATNVFSRAFAVETVDPERHLRFTQRFADNRAVVHPPKLVKSGLKVGYVRVTFTPDYARFGMAVPPGADFEQLLRNRAAEVAASTHAGVRVLFNKQPVPIKSFKQYAGLFARALAVRPEPPTEGTGDGAAVASPSPPPPPPLAYDAVKIGDIARWEVAVAAVLQRTRLPARLGFVNSQFCAEGTHMELVTRSIEQHVCEKLKIDKAAHRVYRPAWIREMTFVCVKAIVPNPTYTSQNKEKLKLPAREFGFDWVPSAAFWRQFDALGLLEHIQQRLTDSSVSKLNQLVAAPKRGGAVHVAKYDGAKYAGKKGHRNALFICEGDSAKALVVAGLTVLGRDHFGCFPIRGKLLNVRGTPLDKVMKNAEITSLMTILGLQRGVTYTSETQLRYQRLILFVDQDIDGSHIAGLILNLFECYFPSLLRACPRYVQRFVTQLIRVRHKRTGAVRNFYSQPELEAWVEEKGIDLYGGTRSGAAADGATSGTGTGGTTGAGATGTGGSGTTGGSAYDCTYYKGLGSSSRKEAIEYFRDHRRHLVDLLYNGQTSSELLRQLFDKKCADVRKQTLLTAYDPRAYVDYSRSSVDWDEFCTKEINAFFYASNERAIPHVVDGFKPVQRKIYYTFATKNIVRDEKVAQLGPIVAKEQSYHHGETALTEALIGMAQAHWSTNNVNLLVPQGQFGSRLHPPRVHSAARYIRTRLNNVAGAIFPPVDLPLHKQQQQDGEKIEPAFLVPVLPMALVNGAAGIGSGFSTDVPCYNPRDLIAVIRDWLQHGEAALQRAARQLTPHYADFAGTLVPTDDSRSAFWMRGVFQHRADEAETVITELPVGTWTEEYEEFLERKRVEGKDLISYSKDGTNDLVVRFTLRHPIGRFAQAGVEQDGGGSAETADAIAKAFQLVKKVHLTNMHLFNADGKLTKYAGPADIVRDFLPHRLALYDVRRQALVADADGQLLKLNNQARFVKAVIHDVLPVKTLNKQAVIERLRDERYDQLNGGYDYLLRIPIVNMSLDMVAQCEARCVELQAKRVELAGRTAKQMWLADLDALETALDEFQRERREEMGSGATSEGAVPKRKRQRSLGGAKARKEAKLS